MVRAPSVFAFARALRKNVSSSWVSRSRWLSASIWRSSSWPRASDTLEGQASPARAASRAASSCRALRRRHRQLQRRPSARRTAARRPARSGLIAATDERRRRADAKNARPPPGLRGGDSTRRIRVSSRVAWRPRRGGMRPAAQGSEPARYCFGSTWPPRRSTSKCRCGPVERPVEPTIAMRSPGVTTAPC